MASPCFHAALNVAATDSITMFSSLIKMLLLKKSNDWLIELSNWCVKDFLNVFAVTISRKHVTCIPGTFSHSWSTYQCQLVNPNLLYWISELSDVDTFLMELSGFLREYGKCYSFFDFLIFVFSLKHSGLALKYQDICANLAHQPCKVGTWAQMLVAEVKGMSRRTAGIMLCFGLEISQTPEPCFWSVPYIFRVM